MNSPKLAEAWQCECGARFFNRAAAEKCCVCACGEAVRKPVHGTHFDTCDRCHLKAAIRYANEGLRRTRTQLKAAEEHLVTLKTELAALRGES
jgi:hypothetical protein